MKEDIGDIVVGIFLILAIITVIFMGLVDSQPKLIVNFTIQEKKYIASYDQPFTFTVENQQISVPQNIYDSNIIGSIISCYYINAPLGFNLNAHRIYGIVY